MSELIKVIAPYPRFRYKYLNFNLGYKYCTPEEIKAIKKIPPELGILKLNDGKILNPFKPKLKPKKKRK